MHSKLLKSTNKEGMKEERFINVLTKTYNKACKKPFKGIVIINQNKQLNFGLEHLCLGSVDFGP